MLKLFYAGLIASAMLIACAAQSNKRGGVWERKVDPRLRAALPSEHVQWQSAQTHQVLIKCRGPLSAEQKQRLASAGARLRSEAGAIITAVLPSEAIVEVASLDYVIYIELSKELKTQ